MKAPLLVADEVWLATASLHQRHPDRTDFAVAEIMEQAEQASLTGTSPLRPGVRVHIYLHCVANRPPNPGRYRMLFETANGRRRLFRPTDPCDPRRANGKALPKRNDLPASQRQLVDWYVNEYARAGTKTAEDPILALRGLGKELWADEDADAYVDRLREGWQ